MSVNINSEPSLVAARHRLLLANDAFNATVEELQEAEATYDRCEERGLKARRVYEGFISAGSSAKTEADKANAIAQATASLDGCARIDVERAMAKAALEMTRQRRDTAADECRTAKENLVLVAEGCLLSDMVARAQQVEATYQTLMRLGNELRSLSQQSALQMPINRPAPALPDSVVKALSKIPARCDLDTPIHVLRFGEHSNLWQQRLDELTGVSAS